MGFSLTFICYTIIWSAAFSSWAVSYSLCPSTCSCKWKSGKQTAECVGHGLSTIPSGLNAGVQVIDLSRNNFETIETRVFQEKGLVNLQKIYLSECGIYNIETEAFLQLSNLVELDLSINKLSAVPREALYDCDHLRRLQLAQNPIKVVAESAFSQLSRLTFLDLSKCEIEVIYPGAFNGLEKLEFLKLDGNRLSELSIEIVQSLTKLSGLYLNSNPWNCDCRLRNLRKWMLDQNIPLAVPPHCDNPVHNKGTTWDVMVLDDFACPPKIISQSVHEVSVQLHKNVSILCQVDSIPRASVYWEVGGRYLTNISTHPDFRGKYSVDADEVQSSTIQSNRLTVINAAETDEDYYTCIAENRAGNSSMNFTIMVVSPYPMDGSWSTTQIVIISVSMLLVVLIALAIIAVFVFHPIHLSAATKTSGGGVLRQLKSKNRDTVETRNVSGEKEEKDFKVSDKPPRQETGSSGYGSDQLTPDLVSKIVDTGHGPSLSTSTVSCSHPDLDNPTISEAYGPVSDHWSGGRIIPPRYDESPGRSVYSEIFPNPCYGNDDSDYFVSQSPTVLHHADFHPDRHLPQNDRVRTLRAGFECPGGISNSDGVRDDLYVNSSSSGLWKRSPLAVSSNVSHYTLPTKARFSPDEGYAEEALEGTEV